MSAAYPLEFARAAILAALEAAAIGDAERLRAELQQALGAIEEAIRLAQGGAQ